MGFPKKVLTVGVFDMFHFGHLRLFKNCRKYGDYLIVAVQETDCILRYKPEAKILYSTEERSEMIEAIALVNEVVTYKDVDQIVKDIDFDVFAKGADQSHSGFQRAVEWCIENGKEVVEIKRTEGISSTYIKKIINDFKS